MLEKRALTLLPRVSEVNVVVLAVDSVLGRTLYFSRHRDEDDAAEGRINEP